MKKDVLLTRILKAIAVTILLLIAAAAIFLEGAVIVRKAAVTWHWHAGAILLISFCFCAAYLLVRGKSDSAAEVYCQRCHTVGGHTTVASYRGSINPLAFHFGGFLFSILFSASREQRFRCRECGETFSSHTPTSRAYRLLFFLMLALIVNYFWSELDDFWNAQSKN